MASIFPSVGMNGSYVVNAPFDQKINLQLKYTCVAVETIKGLIAQGKDPFEEIYSPNNLNQSIYTNDLNNNEIIVTLQAASGDFIKIPNSYILNLPDPNGVNYICCMLGISLSAIPENLDLSSIKTEISDLIFSRLGVRSTTKEIVYGASALLSQDEHLAIEVARQANISQGGLLTRTEQMQLTITQLTNRLTILENYIEANQ